jgi:hypothetical protein
MVAASVLSGAGQRHALGPDAAIFVQLDKLALDSIALPLVLRPAHFFPLTLLLFLAASDARPPRSRFNTSSKAIGGFLAEPVTAAGHSNSQPSTISLAGLRTKTRDK